WPPPYASLDFYAFTRSECREPVAYAAAALGDQLRDCCLGTRRMEAEHHALDRPDARRRHGECPEAGADQRHGLEWTPADLAAQRHRHAEALARFRDALERAQERGREHVEAA